MSKHIFFPVCYYILLLVHFGLKAGCKNAEKAVLLPKWYTWHICIFFHVHDTHVLLLLQRVAGILYALIIVYNIWLRTLNVDQHMKSSPLMLYVYYNKSVLIVCKLCDNYSTYCFLYFLHNYID